MRKGLGHTIQGMKQTLATPSPSQVGSPSDNYRRFMERDKRHIVRLRARVRQPMKDLEVSVMITNLSRYGCKIESLISLDSKAPVLLTYRNYPTIRGQIMWTKTGSHGCKFEKSIPDHLMDEMLTNSL